MPIPETTASIVPVVASVSQPMTVSNNARNPSVFMSLAALNQPLEPRDRPVIRFSRQTDTRSMAPERMHNSSPGLGFVQLPIVSSLRSSTTGSPEQRSHISTRSAGTTITPTPTPTPTPTQPSVASPSPTSSGTNSRARDCFSIATTPRRDSPDFSYVNQQGIPVYRPITQNFFLSRAAIIIGNPDIYREPTGPSLLDLILEENAPRTGIVPD